MKRALAVVIICILFFSMFSVFTPRAIATGESPVGYWKFDEGSGTTALDSSGNGNTGTLMNGPQWIDGKIGKALQFHGIDDYVEMPYHPSFNLSSYTARAALILKTQNMKSKMQKLLSDLLPSRA
jgi:hypothetical protein